MFFRALQAVLPCDLVNEHIGGLRRPPLAQPSDPVQPSKVVCGGNTALTGNVADGTYLIAHPDRLFGTQFSCSWQE